MAWKAFTPSGRLKPSSNRDRLVDVVEEFVKFTVLLLPHSSTLLDRFSERMELKQKGKLLTQTEKEQEKDEEARRRMEAGNMLVKALQVDD